MGAGVDPCTAAEGGPCVSSLKGPPGVERLKGPPGVEWAKRHRKVCDRL